MAYKHTVIINGYDITNMCGTYSTTRVPVYSDSVVTMDGVEHKVLIRTKSVLTVSVNPRSMADTAALFDALKDQPAEVSFFDLQTNAQRIADMVCEIPQAAYIRGMMHQGLRWNELDGLKFEEL